MSDLDIHLSAIQAGDKRSFAAWMVQCEEPLRRSLRGFARQVDVEAVLQESLLRVWQAAPSFTPDGRPNSLLRFGHRVARNLAVSEVRKARTTAVDPSVMEAGLDEAERAEPRPPDPMLRRIIAMCRQKLPTKPGAALGARLESGGAVPDATLAEGLGMKRNTFLQNFTRARKLLAACLQKNGVDLGTELA